MEGVLLVLYQIRDGVDFSPPGSILRISPKAATLRLPGWPYSIADNVAHTVYWQEVWLAKLKGEPTDANYGEDWPTVAPEEWKDVGDRFLYGFEEAIVLARAGHDTEILARIAHHTAYHVGQWALLKRLANSQH